MVVIEELAEPYDIYNETYLMDFWQDGQEYGYWYSSEGVWGPDGLWVQAFLGGVETPFFELALDGDTFFYSELTDFLDDPVTFYFENNIAIPAIGGSCVLMWVKAANPTPSNNATGVSKYLINLTWELPS